MPTPTPTIFIPYHALDDLHLRGTRAGQPPAAEVIAGTLYCVSDEGDRLERGNGSAWEPYAGGSGGGTTPTLTPAAVAWRVAMRM